MHQVVHETIIDKKSYTCCNEVDCFGMGNGKRHPWPTYMVYIPEVHYYYTRAFVVLNVMGEEYGLREGNNDNEHCVPGV
jgi:hypothetical protein